MSFDLLTRRYHPEHDLSLQLDADDAVLSHEVGRGVDAASVAAELHTADDGRRVLGQITDVLRDAYAAASNFSRLAGERKAFVSRCDAINRYAKKTYVGLPKSGPLGEKDKRRIGAAAEQAYGVLLDGSKRNRSFAALADRVQETVRTNVRTAARDATDLGKKLRPWLIGAAVVVGGGYVLGAVLPIIFLTRKLA